MLKNSDKPNIVINPDNINILLSAANSAGIDSADIFISLSSPPKSEEEIVVKFGRKSGSKDISSME